MVHLPGVNMPADYMTKKTDQKKVDASVAYASNAANAVPITVESADAATAATDDVPLWAVGLSRAQLDTMRNSIKRGLARIAAGKPKPGDDVAASSENRLAWLDEHLG